MKTNKNQTNNTMNKTDIIPNLPNRLIDGGDQPAEAKPPHPMLGKKCVVRTYSAGVHTGTVVWINPENSMECVVRDGYRIYNWSGALSLSKVASHGITGGKTQATTEVTLTNAIEYLPATEEAFSTYEKFAQ